MAYVIPPATSGWGAGSGVPTAPDGSPLMTPDMLAQQRAYGMNELQQGESAAPIQSWTQGAARLAQALMGGMAFKSANQREMAYRSQAMQSLIDAMNGGGSGGGAVAAPTGAAAAPATGGAASDQGSAVDQGSAAAVTPPTAAAAAPVAGGIDARKLLAAASNPYLSPGGQSIASAMLNYQLMPHPKSITYNPITGAAGTFEPITGQYSELPGASAGGGNGSYPPGFVFGGAKPYTDPSNGETGLIDVNGVKAVIGKPNPTTDQSAASNAAALAAQANELLKQSEGGQTGVGSELERQAMGIPIVGAMVSGPEARKFETGKAQFLSAVRSLAISNRINPETIDFNEKALFAQRGDSPEEVQQKQNYRAQMIKDLQTRAGPFAPKTEGAPQSAAPPAGGKLPTIANPADAMKLPSGSHFLTPDGREKVVP